MVELKIIKFDLCYIHDDNLMICWIFEKMVCDSFVNLWIWSVVYPGIQRHLKAKIIDCRRTAGFSGKKFTVTIKFVVMMMESLILLWWRRRSNRNYNIFQWILTYLTRMLLNKVRPRKLGSKLYKLRSLSFCVRSKKPTDESRC